MPLVRCATEGMRVPRLGALTGVLGRLRVPDLRTDETPGSHLSEVSASRGEQQNVKERIKWLK